MGFFHVPCASPPAVPITLTRVGGCDKVASANGRPAFCDNVEWDVEWLPAEHAAYAPLAQRIEQWCPKPCAQVRVLEGAPLIVGAQGQHDRDARDNCRQAGKRCGFLARFFCDVISR